MAEHLLDTSVISILHNPDESRHESVKGWLASEGGRVLIPAIAAAEIEFGIASVPRPVEPEIEEKRQRIRRFLSDYKPHIPFQEATVEPYALVRAELWFGLATRKIDGRFKEKDPLELCDISGKQLGIDEKDLMICAVAMEYQFVLATGDCNTKMRAIKAAADKVAKSRPEFSLTLREFPGQ